MKCTNKQIGFTAVELLITLFIAAAFLLSGLQLYAVIIKGSGEIHAQVSASNVVYDYLQRYKPSTANPCTVQAPLTNQTITVYGLSNVTVSVAISCPYGSSSVSKVLVTLRYNNPQQTVSNATYAAPQSIITNGLVLNLDAGNVKSVKGRKSIINWDSWTVGTGATTDYGVNGDGNSRLIDTNPWGASDIVWDVSNQDAASDADGGWNGSSFNIDNTKMYRFTTWVRRKTIGNGSFYFGTSGGGASVLNRSDGAANGNPYFYNAAWWGPVNQWYLVVGYVWPAGSGTGAVMPESGVYALNGTKIASASDFMWQPTTTSSYHRSYLYYSTDTTTNQQWYQPRVDVVDGTEPTVTELRNNAGNTWYDLSDNNKNGTLVNGTNYTASNNVGAFTFDGVNDYITVPIAIPSGKAFTIDVFGKVNSIAVSNNFISSNPPVFIRVVGGKPRWGIYVLQDSSGTLGWSFNNGSTSILPNVVYDFTMVYDGATLKGYINSVLDINIPFAGQITASTANMAIGYTTGGEDSPLNGSVYATKMYNRALSNTEVIQNFNALRGRYGL